MLVGAIVGGIAGASGSGSEAQSFKEGFAVGQITGRNAAIAFFQRYGLFLFLGQISVFTILCWFSVLPGVGRYKKLKLERRDAIRE
jgi:hypothetical protein